MGKLETMEALLNARKDVSERIVEIRGSGLAELRARQTLIDAESALTLQVDRVIEGRLKDVGANLDRAAEALNGRTARLQRVARTIHEVKSVVAAVDEIVAAATALLAVVE